MRGLGMFVPTRRPGNAARLWEAMQTTCRADTTLVLGVDDDDPDMIMYPPGPAYMVLPDTRYVTAWVNAMSAELASEYQAIGHFGDDNVPRTPGWDERVLKALKKKPFTFADDCYPGRPAGTLSCHIFMRREAYDALGYFGPPEISHMYVDVAWFAWCLAAGHEFLADVQIPHLHYTNGAAHDETYARSYARTAADLAAWHAYSRRDGDGGMNADIIKLGGRPFTAERLSRFNRDLNIPEVWSY